MRLHGTEGTFCSRLLFALRMHPTALPPTAASPSHAARPALALRRCAAQAEALADRLCGRLAAAGADDVRSARSVAFCLEKLPPTDKALRRLIERRSAYAHRLSDDEVYASMCEVAAKARRTGKAPLIQAAVRAVLQHSTLRDCSSLLCACAHTSTILRSHFNHPCSTRPSIHPFLPSPCNVARLAARRAAWNLCTLH